MATLDEPINQLYDTIQAAQRAAVDAERVFRDLAGRDDLAVDNEDEDTTPSECLAQVTDSLSAMKRHLVAAEQARADAKEAAAQLYIARSKQ